MLLSKNAQTSCASNLHGGCPWLLYSYFITLMTLIYAENLTKTTDNGLQ